MDSEDEAAILRAVNSYELDEEVEEESSSYSDQEEGSDAPDKLYATGSELDMEEIQSQIQEMRRPAKPVKSRSPSVAPAPAPKAVGKKKGKKEDLLGEEQKIKDETDGQ